MSGPFALKYLHLFLRDQSAGAFICSRSGRSADFVGSHPTDLAEGIRRIARDSDYRYFGLSTPPRPTMRTISSTIGIIAIVRLITLFLPCRGSALIGDVPLRDVPPAP